MSNKPKVKKDQDKPVGPPPPKLMTGFAILVDVDGNVFVERDQRVLAVQTDREPTLIEIRRYISEILMDLQAQSAAEYTTDRLRALMAKANVPVTETQTEK